MKTQVGEVKAFVSDWLHFIVSFMVLLTSQDRQLLVWSAEPIAVVVGVLTRSAQFFESSKSKFNHSIVIR